MNNKLKVTGSFTSGYHTDSNWLITNTNVSAMSNTYSIYDLTKTENGIVVFNTDTYLIAADLDPKFEAGGIEAIAPDSYSYFEGSCLY